MLLRSATAGIPSSYDANLEEPLVGSSIERVVVRLTIICCHCRKFVRLLKEDESTTMDFPSVRPIIQDPFSTLTQ